MDTSSSKQDGKLTFSIIYSLVKGALNVDQTLNDISASDAMILKALGGDLNQSISPGQVSAKTIDENLSIHMFLEDLHFLSKFQKEKLMSLKSGLSELLALFEQVRNKMMDLGNIFSEIQTSHKDLEDFKRPEISKIVPPLSNVYADLKTSLYSWANIYSHQHKHIKKLFEPCIASLESGNHTNLLNMGVRS